jgi:Flp pilus assembly CpaF family ATPase
MGHGSVVASVLLHRADARERGRAPGAESIVKALFCELQVVDAACRRLLGEQLTRLLNEPIQELSGNFQNGRMRWFVDDGAGPMREVAANVSPRAIEAMVRLLATVNGIALDLRAPFLNCVLACGARFSAALSPVADGVQVSFRTHVRILRSLLAFMAEERAAWLKAQIVAGKNILVAGGTNTGKTTLLNSIIAEIPIQERLAVIEDAPELQVREGNVIRRTATDRADLKRHVKEILRMRPDRIIIGEVRGPESWDMIDAMRTGHSGGLSTIHANSAEQALTRLAGLAGCTQDVIREGINLVLFIQRSSGGRRQVAEVKEVC